MMPLPHRLPRSEIGWQVPPWATRAEPPRDAFQYQTMVTESVAPLALIRWHHRFDSRPELIRNHTHPRHRSIVAGQRLPIRETRPRYAEGALDANLAVVEVVKSIADQQDATPAQVALAWLRYRADALGVASVPIPGTRRASRVEENLGSLSVTLTPEQLDTLGAAGAAVSGNRFADMSYVSGGRE